MSLMRRLRKKTPAQVQIKPQRMGFDFTQGVPRYWFANDPVLTHFMNVFSLTFPDGEQFFVDSVRALRDRVTDPERQKDISGFIGQEAMHSLEHKSFNAHLETQGYAALVQEASGLARKMVRYASKNLAPEWNLAATAGLEHITAILADAMLHDEALLNEIHPSVRDLWMWHAIEETEHKAVAFDLYKDVEDDYIKRVGIFLRVTLALGVFMSNYTYQFLRQDQLHHSPRVLARGLWKMWGVRGMFTRVIPAYLDYLRPGFHPWDVDNSALIAKYKARMEAAIAPQYRKAA